MHASQYDRLAEETPAWLDHHENIFRAFVERRTEDAVRGLEQHIEAARAFLFGLPADIDTTKR